MRCITSGSAECINKLIFGASKNFVGWLKDILAENIWRKQNC